jgi:uncharacterized protein YcfJ
VKRVLIGLAIFSTSTAFAESFLVDAKVTKVKPNFVIEQVPRQVCSMVNTPVQVMYPGQVISRKRNMDQVLLNTALGGVIGHQFGKGSGKDAATIVGALIGYNNAGDEVDMTRGVAVTEYRQMEQCRTEYSTQQVQSGYIVSYDLNGLTGTKFSNNYPGQTIQVNVSIGD